MKSTWWDEAVPVPDRKAQAAAAARQRELTKPPGSLGRLETLATRLAALQGSERPVVDTLHMTVFAADHGVAAEGVSAFPQSVTLEMVRNFARGGAAISVLARQLGAALEVVDLGTAVDGGEMEGVIRARIRDGTHNFCEREAMSRTQAMAAFRAGRDAANRAWARRAQLFIGGDMGIANTTSATAAAALLLELEPADLAGPGTGLDEAGVAHKIEVIRRGIGLHAATADDPVGVLTAVGGFEIAALAAAYTAAAQRGIPSLVDGFIASVAALAAVRRVPALVPWLFHGHRSAEPGHARVLEALSVQPLLDLGMRLGEGTGAAVAVPLLRAACALHDGMATFAEAGVAKG